MISALLVTDNRKYYISKKRVTKIYKEDLDFKLVRINEDKLSSDQLYELDDSGWIQVDKDSIKYYA